MAAPHLGQRLVDSLTVNLVGLQQRRRRAVRFHYGGDKHVLRADKIVVQAFRFSPGVLQESLRPGSQVNLAGLVGQFWSRFQGLIQSGTNLTRRGTDLGHDPGGNAVLESKQGQKDVLDVQLVVVEAAHEFL